MNEKTTPSKNSISASMGKHLLPIIPLLLAGMVIVLALNKHIERVRANTEQETLASIAMMYGIQADAPKDEIYQHLSQSVLDYNTARKARIAQNCGMEPDWNQIFDRIEKLEEPARDRILMRIANDYSLPKDMSLRVMKRLLTQKGGRGDISPNKSALKSSAMHFTATSNSIVATPGPIVVTPGPSAAKPDPTVETPDPLVITPQISTK